MTYALIMNKETNFLRLKILKKNRLFKYYALYEFNFDNVRIFTKKRVLWTRIEATLNRQSSEILTEFRRLR